MLRILGQQARACDGISRREILRAGALSLFSGVTLPRLLRAESLRAAARERCAKSVILLNLFGGPSHIDMFDMKPEAPDNIRGEFRPVSTSVPGLDICELLPKTAARMHLAALIRTHSHPYNSHNPYNVLTGFTGGNDRENYFAKRTDHPSMASVMQYAGMRTTANVPFYVIMPAYPGYSQALRRAGPYGGYLGSQFDPLFTVCDPTFDREPEGDKFFYDPITPVGEAVLPSVDALPEITLDRLDRRKHLLSQFDERAGYLDAAYAVDGMDRFQQKAFDLLTSNDTRRAFDLSDEPEPLRRRYGDNLYGACLLTARRLIEAGVRFVAVNSESRGAGHWDMHENNFGMLRKFHLPALDDMYSALVDDLEDRGLLDSTLVVVMGEMGRTPIVNRKAGRDHWPQCGFALLAGGGVKRGYVFGRTDKQGAYPVDRPVSSGDIVATIYELMGVNSRLAVPDLSGRPIHVSHGGEPIWDVIA